MDGVLFSYAAQFYAVVVCDQILQDLQGGVFTQIFENASISTALSEILGGE